MLFLPLVLGGCVTAGIRPPPPSRNVAIPPDCDPMLVAVAAPDVTAADDARLALLRERAARMLADSRIVTGRACWERVRRQYSGA